MLEHDPTTHALLLFGPIAAAAPVWAQVTSDRIVNAGGEPHNWASRSGSRTSGSPGSEFGIRGFIAAYDALTSAPRDPLVSLSRTQARGPGPRVER